MRYGSLADFYLCLSLAFVFGILELPEQIATVWKKCWPEFIMLGLALGLLYCKILWVFKFQFVSPGVAFIAMAIAAGFMNLQSQADISPRRKFWWAVILIAYGFVEFKSIAIDKNERDREFGQIIQGINVQIQANVNNFRTTINKEDRVLTQTQTMLDKITGGNSYAVVVPVRTNDDNSVLLEVKRGKHCDPNPIYARVYLISGGMGPVTPRMELTIAGTPIFNDVVQPSLTYQTSKKIPVGLAEWEGWIYILSGSGETEELLKVVLDYRTKTLRYSFDLWRIKGGKTVERQPWMDVAWGRLANN
jgi:hypothetical protein